MRERPILFNPEMVRAILAGHKTQTRRVCKQLEIEHFQCSPYGQPGDQLWVRETCCIAPKNWGFIDDTCVRDEDGDMRHIGYKADGHGEEAMRDYGLKWRPSIHMPRWASRITLEITDVRVQRIQDISEEDAIAEGIPAISMDSVNIGPVEAFADLWNSINAKRGYSWESDPWVWVYTFKKI